MTSPSTRVRQGACRAPCSARISVHGSVPGLGPGMEGGDELGLVDQAVLQREQSEKEMAVGGGSHEGAPGQDVVPANRDHGNGPVREGNVAKGHYRINERTVHIRRSALVASGPLR